jgi:hypothetical protein
MSRSSEDDGLIDVTVWKTEKPLIFEGFYAYSDEVNEIRIAFLIEATEQDGSFHGLAMDTETENLFEKGAITVKGFIENELISFVKTYPSNYLIDENGQPQIAPGKQPHAVEYLGDWIEEEKRFVGTYTVKISETWTDRFKGNYRTEEFVGHWEMKPSEATVLETWPWIFFPVNE